MDRGSSINARVGSCQPNASQTSWRNTSIAVLCACLLETIVAEHLDVPETLNPFACNYRHGT